MNKDLQEEGSEKGEQQEQENKKSESAEKEIANEEEEENCEQPNKDNEEQNENQEYKAQEDQEKQEGEEGAENQEDEDKRSIYVKNVDYMTSEQELIEFFQDCGKINRVKIPLDKYTGQPKGYAYIEFAEVEAVENAKALTDCLLRGRAITVIAKRTNVPAFPNRTRARRPFMNQYRGYYSYRGPAMFSRFPGRRRYRPF